MEQHVKVVAILNIVLGSLGVLGALFVLVFFGGLAGVAGADARPDAEIGATVLALIAGVGSLVIAIFSVPSIIAGWGLLKFRPWSQTLGIVVSVLNLLSVPLGTALGIYGLWVLLNEQTKPLFRPSA